MGFQAVKGCEDFYQQDFATREAVFDVLRRVARSFGFNEVGTPAMESVALLAKKSGEEIKQQLFMLEKKGSEEIALRFDLTVPFTRLFMAKQKELPKPVKWFGIERMWRYEAPQKGRLREFYQLSVELFGSDRPEADAEIITIAIECLKAFGLTEDDVVLKLNNRKLLEGVVSSVIGPGVDEVSLRSRVDGVIRVIDKRSKVSDKEFIDALLETGLDQEQAEKIDELSRIEGDPAMVITALQQWSLSPGAKKGLEEIEAILPLIPAGFVRMDLSLARGLAYYTGNVFEVFDRKGEFRAILGGGRYDELVGLFDGEPTPATGFGMGYATLSLLLQKRGLLPKPSTGPDYYIVGLGAKENEAARALASRLRTSARVETDLVGRKLDKQMKYANAIGAKKVIVIGPQELATGIVKVKDMASGEEVSARMDAL